MPLEAQYRRRLVGLQHAMQERGVEWIWVEPSVSFLYLTGIEPISIERLTGLLVPASGELRLVVPLMLAEECEAIEARVHAWTDSEGPEAALAAALEGVGRLHIQGSLPAWAWELLRKTRGDMTIELDPGAVASMRERKDEQEAGLLREAGRAADSVVEWVAGQDLDGLTERDLAGRIQIRFLELGVVPTEIPLVASGAGAAMPHYAGGDVPVSTDDVLLLDFGCAVGGYWSDITRPLFPREPDPEVMAVYDLVHSAYEAAFATVAPGVPCADVDRAARKVISEAGHGDAFLHRTGHGVGLEVHEPPYIREGNEQPLEVGHVFSIEPGIYLSGRFGLRYENLIYLGPDGPESLNAAPRLNYFTT